MFIHSEYLATRFAWAVENHAGNRLDVDFRRHDPITKGGYMYREDDHGQLALFDCPGKCVQGI